MKRKLVVLTPVKNESWILPTFLAAVSVWADYIVIADQGSTDGSLEIYKQFPKVVIVNNDSVDLDENYRDALMVNKARELVGVDSILFRLDADEILIPIFDTPQWESLQSLPPGTHVKLVLGNILPGFHNFFDMDESTYFAFIDDGRPKKKQEKIHDRSLFSITSNDKVFLSSKMRLLHYQFVDWKRMESKHRYYQCYEKVIYPKKSVIDIFRIYHWMYNPTLPMHIFEETWKHKYAEYNVDITNVKYDNNFWWDDKVLDFLSSYSHENFKYIEMDRPSPIPSFHLSTFAKCLLFYLRITTKHYNRKKGFAFIIIRKVDTFIKTILKL